VSDTPVAAPRRHAEPWEELGVDLLIDDETVKCWIETVPPGERRPAHTHRYPWVTVVLSGAHGESRDDQDRLIKQVTMETGQVTHNRGEDLPMRHYVRNLSTRTLVMVAVELRGQDGEGRQTDER
jgi:mannose-6-phosphate isomerase-like protein (cupin superfamily)